MIFSIRNILLSFLLLFSFLPFISFYPINSDTQPVAHVIAIVLIIFFTLRIEISHFCLLLGAMILLFYANPFGELSGITKPLAYLLGFFLYIAYQNINHELILRILKISIVIYFIYMIFIILLPNTALNIQSLFVRELNISSFSASAFLFRGIPVLGTEPGLVGAHLCGMLLILYILNRSVKVNPAYYLFLILSILATKSGMGYLYLCFVVIYILYDSKFYALSLVVGLLGIFIVSYVQSTLGISNRGIVILISLLSGESIMTDSSALKRIYDFMIIYPSLIHYPFGVGWGDAAYTANMLAENYNLKPIHDYGKTIGLVSSMATLTVSFGIFFLVHFLFTLSTANCRKILYFFPILYISFSFSAAYPIIWMILALRDPRDN